MAEDKKVKEVVEEKSDRQVRWEAFLVKAREVNPERFDRQKENKEFEKIPDSFV